MAIQFLERPMVMVWKLELLSNRGSFQGPFGRRRPPPMTERPGLLSGSDQWTIRMMMRLKRDEIHRAS